MSVTIFNLLMLAVDLALLAWIRRRPSPATLGGATLAALIAIGGLALTLTAVQVLWGDLT